MHRSGGCTLTRSATEAQRDLVMQCTLPSTTLTNTQVPHIHVACALCLHKLSLAAYATKLNTPLCLCDSTPTMIKLCVRSSLGTLGAAA